jgi:hypothetical protein
MKLIFFHFIEMQYSIFLPDMVGKKKLLWKKQEKIEIHVTY